MENLFEALGAAINPQTAKDQLSKSYLTIKQYDDLVFLIYNSLMQSEEMDMDKMGEAKEEAETIVRTWAARNNFLVI